MLINSSAHTKPTPVDNHVGTRPNSRTLCQSLVNYILLAFLPSLQLVLRTHAFAERQDALNPINWVERGSFAEKPRFSGSTCRLHGSYKKTSTDPIPCTIEPEFIRCSMKMKMPSKMPKPLFKSHLFCRWIRFNCEITEDAGHLDDSLTAINRAISLRPSELRYKSLRGDVLEREGFTIKRPPIMKP
jgi:hypothetical protein